MPNYELWKSVDNTTIRADAANDAGAVQKFGTMLGVELTLNDNDSVAPYMMRLVEDSIHWVGPPKIPVWVVDR